jgi:hypothetical protein
MLMRYSEIYNRLTGDSASYDLDSRHTILEIQVNLDLLGFEDEENGEPTGIALPYVVSIDSGSRDVLSIRRNWYEGDARLKLSESTLFTTSTCPD